MVVAKNSLKFHHGQRFISLGGATLAQLAFFLGKSERNFHGKIPNRDSQIFKITKCCRHQQKLCVIFFFGGVGGGGGIPFAEVPSGCSTISSLAIRPKSRRAKVFELVLLVVDYKASSLGR